MASKKGKAKGKREQLKKMKKNGEKNNKRKKVKKRKPINVHLEAMERGKKEADKYVKLRQKRIKPGTCFVQITPYGFIFGQVQESKGSFYKTKQGRNFRFCKCYSKLCVEGELGDVHVSQMYLLITEDLFLKYKEKDWRVEGGDLLYVIG